MTGIRASQRSASATRPPLRGRGSSGPRIGASSARMVAATWNELEALTAGIGECWACGPTAAAMHRFDGFDLRPPFHVVTMRQRSVHRVRHEIHTTLSMPRLDTCVIDGIPATSAVRTIIDLAPTSTREVLTAAIDSATRDRSMSDDFFIRQLVAHRSRGRKGISALLDIMTGIEVTKGGHSWLEREFLRLCKRAGLPRPLTQQIVGTRRAKVIRVDCRFPGTNVVVEILGYTFHRTLMQMQADAERSNEMVLRGLRPFQFTFLHVVEDGDWVAGQVAEALGLRAAR